MREYFKEREDVLLALENWQILWREKIASDERENAPNRYQNRGGNLEKELKVCLFAGKYEYNCDLAPSTGRTCTVTEGTRGCRNCMAQLATFTFETIANQYSKHCQRSN